MIAEVGSFMDFSWALQPAGIYFLLRKGEVQYVGKSTNVPVRIAQHRNKFRRHVRGLPPQLGDNTPVVSFDEVRVLLSDKRYLDALEIQWIQRLNPPCNTQLNRPAPPMPNLKKLPFFNNLLDLGRARQKKADELSKLLPVQSLRSRPHDKWLNRTRLIRGVTHA